MTERPAAWVPATDAGALGADPQQATAVLSDRQDEVVSEAVRIGAIVLDQAVVGAGALVGAGSLVTPSTRIPPGMVAME